MICWSCQEEAPDDAEFCPHCEAEMRAGPAAEEEAAAAGVLAAMSPELIGELRDAFEKSATGEEFVNRVMVGDCPACGGAKTGDCENDPVIEDPCVGRCFDCGQLWRLDCGELFKVKSPESINHDCPVWEEMFGDADDVDEPD